ncbi:MAG: hypothetical protein K8S27_12090 [Candidatus Omnitrophica bacterium]|nr:hypothetical protein [Candidatus Omnitrophota bacterium]
MSKKFSLFLFQGMILFILTLLLGFQHKLSTELLAPRGLLEEIFPVLAAPFPEGYKQLVGFFCLMPVMICLTIILFVISFFHDDFKSIWMERKDFLLSYGIIFLLTVISIFVPSL